MNILLYKNKTEMTKNNVTPSAARRQGEHIKEMNEREIVTQVMH